MDSPLAIERAKELNISVVQIVREEYEMILLAGIFDSQFGSQLVFRGGTALRLAYGSPRFSDDLDFSELQPIEVTKFQKRCEEIAAGNNHVELVEVLRKRFTLFALFKVHDPTLPATISIKIEISGRKEPWKQDEDYTLMRLQSTITPLTVLAQVASLKRIKREKLRIIPPRIRDIFDLWYIGQRLHTSYTLDFSAFDKQEVKRELYRILTKSARRLIEPWLQKN